MSNLMSYFHRLLIMEFRMMSNEALDHLLIMDKFTK